MTQLSPRSSIILLLLFLILPTHTSNAHDRQFAYTQQSMVLPGNSVELEIWNTLRFSREYFYRRLDTRAEFEFGLGRNVMTAIYLNHEMKTFDDGKGASGGSKTTEATVSLSNEWKYKLMDPAADPFGFALYAEGTIGLDEAEVEGKLILDKQTGPTILACNLVVEHEWETEIENGRTKTTRALKPGIDAGLAWFVTPSFTVGAEARYLNVIENGDLTHSAVFLGPSLSYSSDKFWFTINFLPQIANLASAVSGNLDLLEYERYQARLLFSVEI